MVAAGNGWYHVGTVPKQVNLRLGDELLARLDVARGDVPRNRFVVRALEKALSEADGSIRREQAAPDPVVSSEAVRAAAPSRVPEKPSKPAAEWDDPEAHRKAQEDFGRAVRARAAVPRASSFNIGPKPFTKPRPKP